MKRPTSRLKQKRLSGKLEGKWLKLQKSTENDLIVGWCPPPNVSELTSRPDCEFPVDPHDTDLPGKLALIFLRQIPTDSHFLFHVDDNGACRGWIRGQ